MDETQLDWAKLRSFVAIARGKTLAAAAKTTKLSSATLGRHALELERFLGCELFNRRQTGYELTEAGKEIFDKALGIEAQVAGLLDTPLLSNRNLPITISAGTWMTWFLTKNIDALTMPGAHIIFTTTEGFSHIGRREAIIGIRNKRQSEASNAVRCINNVVFAQYRATANTIAKDRWISCRSDTPSARWVRDHKGDLITHEVSNPRSLLDLALAGAGNVVLPCFVGEHFSQLQRVGPIIDELAHEQWLVLHGEDRHLGHVRQFIDRLMAVLKAHRRSFDLVEAPSG
ncbi:LysR family transcriptional regulator [Thalassospira sp. MA62]|nr:LysR family transcriptional regulator [Thalassospira sp. MA62]